jgi:hypothetical protein
VPLDALAANLLSPVVLAFVLGAGAALVRSDLRLPPALYSALSIYLLLAIGLKGGVALSKTPLAEFAAPAGLTLLLGLVTPLTAYWVLRTILRMDRVNSSALAAHYGSVSAVTFIAALAFANAIGEPAEGFMPALVALLEVPAIVVALMLAFVKGERAGSWRKALHEVVTGKSVVLLVGGAAIGWIAGEPGFEPIAPFFQGGFQGALLLFLLEMGVVAASRLRDVRAAGWPFVAFAIGIAVVHGALGVAGGLVSGLGVGGAAVLGAMVSSASYIAAPAAVRIALPEASPSLYLTGALGLTFPFNLTLGIPLYFWMAARLAPVL